MLPKPSRFVVACLAMLGVWGLLQGSIPNAEAGKMVLRITVELNKIEVSKKMEVSKIVITSKSAGFDKVGCKAEKGTKFTFVAEDGATKALTAKTVLTDDAGKEHFKEGARVLVVLPAGTDTFTEVQFGPGVGKKKK